MKIYFSCNKIKWLRKNLGMSQRTFANSLGVPQTTIYRWEMGLGKPSADHIAGLLELALENGIDFSPFVREESEKQVAI